MEEYKPNLKSELLWIAFVLISLGGFYFLIVDVFHWKLSIPKEVMAAPTAIDPLQVELQRLENLAAERIKEAENLKIVQKARAIIEVLGDAKTGRFSDSQFAIVYHSMEWELGVYFKEEKVFVLYSRAAEEKILVYRPGEWLKEFEKLYNRAEQEKTRRKIEDLKKRYNLN